MNNLSMILTTIIIILHRSGGTKPGYGCGVCDFQPNSYHTYKYAHFKMDQFRLKKNNPLDWYALVTVSNEIVSGRISWGNDPT